MITPTSNYQLEGFNPEAVTVQDCIDNYHMKGLATCISNGKVCGFVKEIEAHKETERRRFEMGLRFTAAEITGGRYAVTG